MSYNFDSFDSITLARKVGCIQKYTYYTHEGPSEICFTADQLEKYSQIIFNKFIEMLSNQQERNADGELQDTEINCTLQFLINAVKEEFFKE